MSSLEREARTVLIDAFGDGDIAATGLAPGRCTVVGEHVDYADGVIACIAIDLAVAVAVRPASDGIWRAASAGRVVEREAGGVAGDIGDRVFAAAAALQASGVAVPAMEIGIASTLPEGAGLSSSAAVICAAAVAMLRWTAATVSAADLARIALVAEHDIVGVPCGPLDQLAVVFGPNNGVLLLDVGRNTRDIAAWNLADTVLVACDTGAPHDVGGAGYRTRRAEASAALVALNAASYRDLTAEQVETAVLDETLRRRARHIVTETLRARQVAQVLAAGDGAALGALMSASHRSLKDDYEVSTPLLNAVVAAAKATAGCWGARMVGAGFGGTAIALVRAEAATACLDAMKRAVSSTDAHEPARAWVLRPAAGVQVLASDVVR